MTDKQAIEAIHAILDGTEWEPQTLDDIAEVVLATGREIRDPNEMEG